MVKIGFIGFGCMGFLMICNFVEVGYDVWVFDVFFVVMDSVVGYGCYFCLIVIEVVIGCEFVVMMLLNGFDVEEIFFGVNGVVVVMDSVMVFMDMSMIVLGMIDSFVNWFLLFGIWMIDVFVGGIFEYVEKGELLILVGGIVEDVVMVVLLFFVMGWEMFYCGGNGIGMCMKMINNYLLIVLNVLMVEMLVFVEMVGFDLMFIVWIMVGIVVGKGFLFGVYDCKVFSGDIFLEFVFGFVFKDFNFVLVYGVDLDVFLGVGVVVV